MRERERVTEGECIQLSLAKREASIPPRHLSPAEIVVASPAWSALFRAGLQIACPVMRTPCPCFWSIRHATCGSSRTEIAFNATELMVFAGQLQSNPFLLSINSILRLGDHGRVQQPRRDFLSGNAAYHRRSASVAAWEWASNG